VHHHHSVLFGHANIVAHILHTHKLAFRGSLESLENGSYVHIVSVEVTNADLAIPQLAMIDRRDYLLSQG
jgi:hypothetical protein